ncbi:glycosyltransferase family 4 protein [Oceanidesulfovibrio marinus]|uniref:Glycosyltransferase family 4 protein n=1 Tax=Oceanidesulfovibrio marinus TaxID=370038 RepID=A0ABX6N9Z7_9BACT|nr:glycosyltransferase family 4 protein [Oceanidesulfovibrio marinus]QJT07413.1 glycosyltransferase family 4 protein [Oceanidesulfovibrio marinus]
MSLPNTAFIALWLPKPSETFVFREAVYLGTMGLPLVVWSHYGPYPKDLSPEMQAYDKATHHGVRHLKHLFRDHAFWRKRRPKTYWRLMRQVLGQWYGTMERQGENWWGLHMGFTFGRYALEQGIEHIHSCWAGGAATSAMVASELTGVPFSFAARAGDIHPPEPALAKKLEKASFVRVNNAFNISYIQSFADTLDDSERHKAKVQLAYNALTLGHGSEAPVVMQPPYNLLAVGRFVATKGYDYLLKACKLLKDRGIDVHLTLAGDGREGPGLKKLAGELGLADTVSFPGFVTHERIAELMSTADVFVMPSMVNKTGGRDGIPNVIMEAMSYTVPVVATDVAGIKEVVRDGETGRLIQEKNETQLADAIADTISDRDRARQWAVNGRDLVYELFDQERNCQHLIDLFAAHSGAATV